MLNSLEIKNFRALEDFKVAKLGRVNLIVGKNNSGKSTVLEALRIYAGNAQRELLVEIAKSHDETYQLAELKFGDLNTAMPFEDLFTGRRLPDDETEIVIGESVESEQALHIGYRISIAHLNKSITNATPEDPIFRSFTKLQYLELIKLQGGEFVSKREVLTLTKNQKSYSFFLSDELSSSRSLFLYEELGVASYSFIPTQLISMNDLAKEWDNIVGTEHENIVRQALCIILPEFQNIYFVQNNEASLSVGGSQRTAKVKLPNLPRPVPLKSLGDGMIRILQLALKLVSAQGGFLLIDELENGLHYSIQEQVWAWLFEVAQRLDIQIFATTHSWDCVQNFTKVAHENETTEGILFRMGKSARTSNRGQIIATVYDKAELYNITQADIEIR